VRGLVRIRAPLGTTVSIIPFGTARGVTLRGLRYGLTDATLDVGRIGVSNVVSRSPFSVRVKHGRLLLVVFSRKLAKRLVR
jgi:thiamine pyrophosphokinase